MTKERQYDGSYLVTEYDKNGQISSQYAEPVNSNGFVGSGATEAGIGNAGKYAITPTDIENYKSMGINVSKDFSTGSGYGSNEEGYGFKNPVTYEEAMIMKKYLDRGKIGPSLDEIRSDVGSSKPTKSAIDAIGDAIGNAFDQVEDAWEKTTKTKLNADPGASVFGQTFNQRSKEYYDSVMKNNAARSQYEQIPESNLPSDDGRSWTDRDVNSADRMKQTKQASGWNEAKGEFNKVAADVLGRYPSDLYGNDIASKANLIDKAAMTVGASAYVADVINKFNTPTARIDLPLTSINKQFNINKSTSWFIKGKANIYIQDKKLKYDGVNGNIGATFRFNP